MGEEDFVLFFICSQLLLMLLNAGNLPNGNNINIINEEGGGRCEGGRISKNINANVSYSPSLIRFISIGIYSLSSSGGVVVGTQPKEENRLTNNNNKTAYYDLFVELPLRLHP